MAARRLIPLGYVLAVTRTREQTVHVRLYKSWLAAGERRYRNATRDLVRFEMDCSGMGEDDILRACLSDALVMLGGGPDC